MFADSISCGLSLANLQNGKHFMPVDDQIGEEFMKPGHNAPFAQYKFIWSYSLHLQRFQFSSAKLAKTRNDCFIVFITCLF